MLFLKYLLSAIRDQISIMIFPCCDYNDQSQPNERKKKFVQLGSRVVVVLEFGEILMYA